MKKKKKLIVFILLVFFLFSTLFFLNKNNMLVFQNDSDAKKYNNGLQLLTRSTDATCTSRYLGAGNGFALAEDADTHELVYLVDECSWALDEGETSIIGRTLLEESNEYTWNKYYSNSNPMQTAYTKIEEFSSALNGFINQACETKKSRIQNTNDADAFNSRMCVTEHKISKSTVNKNDQCDLYIGTANPGFQITRNPSNGTLVYLVDRCAWNLDNPKEKNGIIERTLLDENNEYSWEKYYNNSSYMNITYPTYQDFKDALNKFIYEACEEKRNSVANLAQKNQYDDGLCVTLLGHDLAEEKNDGTCDAYFYDANSGLDVKVVDNVPYYLIGKCAWSLYDSDASAKTIFTLSDDDWREKNGYFNFSSDADLSTKVNDFKKLACSAQKEYISNLNNYNDISKYNESPCSDDIYSGKINYTGCSQADKNVPNLSFTGKYDNQEIKYVFNYVYNQYGSNYFDGICNSWALDAILQYAKNKSEDELNNVCQYYHNLYKEGLLDINDINVLNGTFYGTGLTYLDVNCASKGYKFDIANTTCTEKKLGDNSSYFVGIHNERLSSCEGYEPDTCDSASERKNGIFEAIEEKDKWANGRKYEMGYIPKYYEEPDTKPLYYYPVLVVNGCNSRWAIEDIGATIKSGTDGISGCDWLQSLANKGFLPSNYITTGQKSCPDLKINPALGSCHVEQDDKGNNIYSENGVWVSDEQYIQDCDGSTIYFDENGGYGLSCDNETSWAKKGTCKKTIKKNTSATIKTPSGSILYKGITTNKFKGWSKDSSCKTSDLVSGGSFLTLNSTNTANDITYYACYINNDASYGTYEDNIYKKCDLKNTVLTSRKKSEKTYTESTPSSFKINKYCSVSCLELFKYTYPSVFQTVKSGTYFEFMYNPEITSDRTCTVKYNYNYKANDSNNIWRDDYYRSLENENDKYGEYKAANDTLYSAKNPTQSISSKNDCNCSPTLYGGIVCSEKTHYSNYTEYTYNSSSNNYSTNPVPLSNCGSYPSITTSSYETSLTNAKDNLKKAINTRKELESFNRQCYTALDNLSDNSDYKKTKSFVRINNSTDFDDTLSSNNTIYNGIFGEDSVAKDEKFNRLGITTDNILNYTNTKYPSIIFKYDDGTSSNNEDTLRLNYKKLVKDTGSFTTGDNNVYEKDKNQDDYSQQIGNLGAVSFKAYNPNKNIMRQVIKYFEYIPSKTFYADYTSNAEGNYKASDTPLDKAIKLGNVYPVKLTTNGKKNISFSLSGYLGHDNSLSGTLNGSANTYTCSYNVTNDIIINDTEDSTEYGANFYVRSVDTSDIDPNKRKDEGTLGANWASNKGQALLSIVQDKAKNNNTYNPNNLEYTFVLTPSSIRKIIDYNSHNRYDDFNLKCNSNGGECTSKFLDNYVKGKVDSTNVDIGNTMSEDKLSKQRETWNYYIDNVWTTKNYTYYDKSKSTGALDAYKADYVKTGVLP